MSNSSITRMLKIQTRLRASRDRFYVMAGILFIFSLLVLFKLFNALVLADELIANNIQAILLLLASWAGGYASIKAGMRCKMQMDGETRRWKERVGGGSESGDNAQ